MQSAHTSGLVFSVAKLIEYYSHFYQFRPGDVITTGSPAGVGFGRKPPIFLRAGDVVEVEVEGIGILSNPVAVTLPPSFIQRELSSGFMWPFHRAFVMQRSYRTPSRRHARLPVGGATLRRCR
jgi:hypothetical protein